MPLAVAYHWLIPCHRRCGAIVVDEIPQAVLVCIAVAKRHHCLEFAISPSLRRALRSPYSGRQVREEKP